MFRYPEMGDFRSIFLINGCCGGVHVVVPYLASFARFSGAFSLKVYTNQLVPSPLVTSVTIQRVTDVSDWSNRCLRSGNPPRFRSTRRRGAVLT